MKFFQCFLLTLAIALAVEGCKPKPSKIKNVVGKVTNVANKVGHVANTVGQIGGVLQGRIEEESMDIEMAYKIEKAAFTLCDNEGDNALTWDEVEKCEVSIMINIYLTLELMIVFVKV